MLQLVPRIRRAMFALACGACSACTHVEITGDATVRRESALNVSITPGPSGRLLVSRLTGFGLVPTESGITLGYLKQTLVMPGSADRCQVVVLAEDPQQLGNLQALLSEKNIPLQDLCIGYLGGHR